MNEQQHDGVAAARIAKEEKTYVLVGRFHEFRERSQQRQLQLCLCLMQQKIAHVHSGTICDHTCEASGAMLSPAKRHRQNFCKRRERQATANEESFDAVGLERTLAAKQETTVQSLFLDTLRLVAALRST